MTDEELKETYSITQDEVDMLHEMCDVDTLSTLQIFLNLSTIKVLRHKLAKLGYQPTLAGCISYVGDNCNRNYIDAAIRKE